MRLGIRRVTGGSSHDHYPAGILRGFRATVVVTSRGRFGDVITVLLNEGAVEQECESDAALLQPLDHDRLVRLDVRGVRLDHSLA